MHIILCGNVLSIRIIFILHSIIEKYEIKIREWQAFAMNTMLRSPLQVCTRIYKYLLNLPAIYLSDLGWGIVRGWHRTLCMSFSEKTTEKKRDTVTVYWRNIIFTIAQAISETIKTYGFVSTHYILKMIKKVFVFFVSIGIKDNAVRINSDIRLFFASSFKYYSISATYFEKAFIMQQTLVLSNYRSSKVTLIFLSMYKITVAWHGIDLNGVR